MLPKVNFVHHLVLILSGASDPLQYQFYRGANIIMDLEDGPIITSKNDSVQIRRMGVLFEIVL